jgi:Txe/YoeB family toxin of Txe-Axe toxin-antitoxin module
MPVVINSAIQAQISTLPSADQQRLASLLKQLSNNSRVVPENMSRLADQENLWSARITRNLRAIFRIYGDDVELLAVARPHQLGNYLRRKPANAHSPRHDS